MNEPEILEAYKGLSTPTSPPDDLQTRVDRRIGRRRTVRRGLAGLAVVAVVGGIGVRVLGGSDGDGSLVADRGASGGTSTLTFTRPDGSTHSFEADDLGVVCTTEPLSSKGGRETLVLANRSLLDAMASGDVGEWDYEKALPLLNVSVVPDDVAPGRSFNLPHDGSTDRRAMTFFFADEEGGPRANELSSAEPGASGTVTVHEATCGPNPSLWIEIDGTLGSEVEQPALAITGEYRS